MCTGTAGNAAPSLKHCLAMTLRMNLHDTCGSTERLPRAAVHRMQDAPGASAMTQPPLHSARMFRGAQRLRGARETSLRCPQQAAPVAPAQTHTLGLRGAQRHHGAREVFLGRATGVAEAACLLRPAPVVSRRAFAEAPPASNDVLTCDYLYDEAAQARPQALPYPTLFRPQARRRWHTARGGLPALVRCTEPLRGA